jgi:CBS-domain-containing membrane protein
VASVAGYSARWPRATGNRLPKDRHLTRQDAPFAQRLRQRAAVDVLELSADRYAAREPGNLELARGEQLGDLKVSEIQVSDPLTATTGLDVMELRRAMLDRHARYVPVIDGPTLLGVVSFHDVAKAVYEEQSFENRMLKSYIKNSPDDDGQ